MELLEIISDFYILHIREGWREFKDWLYYDKSWLVPSKYPLTCSREYFEASHRDAERNIKRLNKLLESWESSQ